MQADWEIRNRRGELEQAEHAKKDDLSKEARDKEEETKRQRSRRQMTDAPGERPARSKKRAATEANR